MAADDRKRQMLDGFPKRREPQPEAQPAPGPEPIRPAVVMTRRGPRIPKGVPFLWVARVVLRMGLSSPGLTVYLHLGDRANWETGVMDRVGLRRLAKGARLHPGTVVAAIRELEEAGLVVVERRDRATSRYTVMVPVESVRNGATENSSADHLHETEQQPVARIATDPEASVPKGATDPAPSVPNGATVLDVAVDRSSRRVCESGHAHTLEAATTPTAEPEPEDPFEVFYSFYPRKGKKREARAEWRALDPDLEHEFPCIMQAIGWYRAEPG